RVHGDAYHAAARRTGAGRGPRSREGANRLPVGDDRSLRQRRVPQAVLPYRSYLSSEDRPGGPAQVAVSYVAYPRDFEAAPQHPHQRPRAGERLRGDGTRSRLSELRVEVQLVAFD